MREYLQRQRLGLHRISGLFWYPVSGRISGFVCRISGQKNCFELKTVKQITFNKQTFFLVCYTLLISRYQPKLSILTYCVMNSLHIYGRAKQLYITLLYIQVSTYHQLVINTYYIKYPLHIHKKTNRKTLLHIVIAQLT